MSHGSQAGAATVRAGDKMPSIKLKIVEATEAGAAAVRDVDSAELFRGKVCIYICVHTLRMHHAYILRC